MYYRDRYDASMKLIPFLKYYDPENTIVLAIPRGGVPIGYYISKKFGFRLEVILSKKIRHPENKEFAIGAVGLDSMVVSPEHNVSKEYIKKESEKIRHSLHERFKLYMGGLKPVPLKNKTVIIVDDGAATGNTLQATVEMIRERRPACIIIAIPVAPPETAEKLRGFCDELICLHTPDDFSAVGNYYADFGEVSDEQVSAMMKEANMHRHLKTEL